MSQAAQSSSTSRPRLLHPVTIVLVVIEFAAILTEVLGNLGDAVGTLFVISFNFLILLSVGFTSELLFRRRTRPWLFRSVALLIIGAGAVAYMLIPIEGGPRWLVDLPIAFGIGCVAFVYLWACGLFVQSIWEAWQGKNPEKADPNSSNPPANRQNEEES